jgi:tetratricopeptide (TPR) repeat protein
MLETIHEFAREKLRESGEAERTQRLHAGYFLALAEKAEPELKGPDQMHWLERLEAEHDNMRAALSWSLESKEVDTSVLLAGALWWFWYVRGHLSEGAGWLERTLAASADGARGPRARALHALGWITVWRGDYGRAETLSEESLALYRELRDAAGVARGLSSLGWTAMYKGEIERASVLLEEGMTLSQEVGDDHSTCRALEGLAWVACERGDLELSDALLEESLLLSRRRGNVREAANSLNDLGINSTLRGDYERAAALVGEALPLYRELDDRLGTAASLSTLGAAVLGRGDPEAAEGFILESLALVSMVENQLLTAENLEVLASVTGVRGEDARAARLWGAAESLRESLGIPLTSSERVLHDGHIAAVRSRLGEEAWEEAWAQGQAMSLEEVVAYALGKSRPPGYRQERF